jgi:hypothetical protein
MLTTLSTKTPITLPLGALLVGGGMDDGGCIPDICPDDERCRRINAPIAKIAMMTMIIISTGFII